MKFLAVFLALLVGLIGLATAQICAADGKSNPPGNPQNFPDIDAMHAAGSRKCIQNILSKVSFLKKNLISFHISLSLFTRIYLLT